MPISWRTPVSVTAASGAGFTMPLPAGTADGDRLVAVVSNAGTSGPAAPTGWTRDYSASAGSGQCCSIYTAPYSAGLTRSFTNAASAAVAVCGAYYQPGSVIQLDGAPVAAINTTNNTTLATGAPVTGAAAGDFEVLAYAHTAAPTVTTTASGSTIDLRAVNGTSCTAILGHNNTTSLGASTTCTAFSHTLSATNNRKTGVGILLQAVTPRDLSGSAAGAAVAAASAIGAYKAKNISGAAAGVATCGPAGGGFVTDRIFPGHPTPTSPPESGTTFELGMMFTPQVGISGTVTGVAFYRTQGDTQSFTVSLYDYEGGWTLIERKTISSSVAGWQSVAFDEPEPIIYDGFAYLVTYWSASGQFARTPNVFTSAIDTPYLHAYANGESGASNGAYEQTGAPDGTFGPSSFEASNYHVDVLFQVAVGGGSGQTEISRKVALQGAAAGAATTTAAPSRKRGLVGGSAGAAASVASPSRRRLLGGASDGSASVTGQTSRRRELSGTSAGTAVASGPVNRLRMLQGAAQGSSSTSATVSRRIATVAFMSSAILGHPVTLLGSSQLGSMPQHAAQVRNLVASAAGSATVAAQMSATRALAGISAASSGTGAVLTRRRGLSGAAFASSFVSSPISARRGLVGAAVGRATPAVLMGIGRALQGAAAGRALTIGQISMSLSFLGLSRGTATTNTATISRARALTGASAGKASVSVVLRRARQLAGLSQGRATCVGTVSRRWQIPLSAIAWSDPNFLYSSAFPLAGWDGERFIEVNDRPAVVWEGGAFKLAGVVE